MASDLTVGAPSFCFSCGLPEPGPQECTSCGLSTRPPVVTRSAVIGRVFKIRKGLRKRRAVALDEDGQDVQVLIEGGGLQELGKTELGTPESNGYAASAVLSRGWPLVALAMAIEGGRESGGWDPSTLRGAAMARATDLDEARLLAQDALAAGATEVLVQFPLTESERDWLLASHHAGRGNGGEALVHLARLPRGGYPTKERIVARCWPEILAGNVNREEVAGQLSPLRGQSRLADLMWRLLADTADDDLETLQAGLRALLDTLSLAPDSVPRRRAHDLLTAVGAGGKIEFDISESGPTASVLAAVTYAKGRGPKPARVDLRAILRQSPSIRDDVFDAGLVQPDELRSVPRDEAVAFIARIAPWELTDEEIETAELQDEIARRAFLARDRRRLEALAPRPTAQRFLLLDDLRAGSVESFEANSQFLLDSERRVAMALVAWLQSGGRASVPPELLGDASAWEVIADTTDSPLLTAADTETDAFRVWMELGRARSALFEWRWAEALTAAKDCLRVASEEVVRDEALNMIACAHWQLGNEEAAITALEQALEDSYTEGLQANIGVVAAGLVPQKAAEHLGQLALEAPTVKLRVAAAMRALGLWTITRERWDSDTEADEMPLKLRNALRGLATERIELDQFRRIVKLLANWDPEWLQEPAHLQTSPHRETLEAEVYVALAQGFQEFVKVMAPALRASDAQWLVDERDQMVDSALATLVTDSPSLGAAFFGIEILNAGIPLGVERRIPLTAFAVAAVAANIDPSEGEPKDEFLDMLISAKSELGTVPADGRDRVEESIEYGFLRLGIVYAAARAEQFNQAVDAYNGILFRLRGVPVRSVNRSVVRRATDPILEFCDDTAKLMRKLLDHVTEAEVRQGLEELGAEAQRLGTAIRSLPR